MLFLKLVTPTPPTELKYIGNIFYRYVSFVEYINMRGCKFCCQNINKLKPTPWFFFGKKILKSFETKQNSLPMSTFEMFWYKHTNLEVIGLNYIKSIGTTWSFTISLSLKRFWEIIFEQWSLQIVIVSGSGAFFPWLFIPK